MPELNWNVILTALLYAALTGILNLVLARKSQVEAWSEAHPKLAAGAKLLRAIGLDPWQIIASLSLFFRSKLPEIQKSDSTIARTEQRKADAKALGDDDRNDPPGDSPAVEVLPVSLRRPPGGMDAELSAWDRLTKGSMVLAGIALCALLACSSAPLTNKRCDFQNPDYSLHVAQCRQQIESTCLLEPDGSPSRTCPALVECEAWRTRECAP